MRRFIARTIIALAAATFAMADAAHAEAPYPARPVSLYVAFPPGSGADLIARILAKGLATAAGQSFIVVNKPGATGTIAADSVKRAAPDGYTVLVGTSATMCAFWALKPKPPFDTLGDFVPVTPVTSTDYLLLVNPSVPAKTVPEFIAYLKANPGRVNYGSGGVGGIPHLLGEWFKQASGTDMHHVPYQGTGPAAQAAIGGEVQATFDQVLALKSVRAGQLRALGVTSFARSHFAPDILPIADTLPGFAASSWLGMFVPAGTPPAVAERLRSLWAAASRDPEVVTALDNAANTPMLMPQEEFVRFIKTEADLWRRIGRTAGIVIE